MSFHSLLERCELVILKQDEQLLIEFQSEVDDLILPLDLERSHPKRQLEFKLGRLAAALASEKILGHKLNELPIGPSRAPVWPKTVIGSLTHGAGLVAAAVGDARALRGVGIDLEEWGRVKSELAATIMPGSELVDLKGASELSSLSEREILTLVFSAKEALYKALYPEVGHFFGFEAARCSRLVLAGNERGTFELVLTKSLGPWAKQGLFSGRFAREQQTLFTAIELLNT